MALTTLLAEIAYRIDTRMSPFRPQDAAPLFTASYLGCLLIAVPLIAISLSRAARRRDDAALKSALSDNLDSVGALVDTLSDGDGRYERQCRESLIRLLPRLNGNNSHLLDEYRQAKLRYIVRPPASPIYSTYLTRLTRNSAQNVALRIAIIEALSRVGDGEALTMFNELLECRAYTVNERRIQQTARDSRPALVARVEKQPARQSLLRPANCSDIDSLLRIARSELELPPQDLPHVNE